ncbi:MAG: zinc ABC transporter substrate-binding protein [Actinobacteria bacterium]|nr:zinc ABC transporter substrate-binding protein [Actinomycetota bacterium]
MIFIPISWARARIRSRSVVVAALCLAAAVVGPAPAGAAGNDRPTVVAAFYPLAEAAQGVGRGLVDVVNLTPPGQGPHDLQLSGRAVQRIEQADMGIYLGSGFQPQVEKAIKKSKPASRRIDVLETVGLLPVDAQLAGTKGKVDGEVLEGDVDPHVWLDPVRMIEMVDAITDFFVRNDPANADTYRANAKQYLASLDGLDAEYRAGLAQCRSRAIVTSHRAFGYLSDSYDLRQIPIAGVSPEVEPDPKTLAAIADEAEKEGVTTIFLETIAPPDLAKTVAREIGADLDLLDPIEGLSRKQLRTGETYASIMRDNLTRLRKGLGCR